MFIHLILHSPEWNICKLGIYWCIRSLLPIPGQILGYVYIVPLGIPFMVPSMSMKMNQQFLYNQDWNVWNLFFDYLRKHYLIRTQTILWTTQGSSGQCFHGYHWVCLVLCNWVFYGNAEIPPLHVHISRQCSLALYSCNFSMNKRSFPGKSVQLLNDEILWNLTPGEFQSNLPVNFHTKCQHDM